jgi:hypothetical protein
MLPQNYKLHEGIRIEKIIFDESNDVTIFAIKYDIIEETFNSVTYICKFDILTNLLMLADEEGEIIIFNLATKIENETERPTILDVKQLLGNYLKIEEVCFDVYKPLELNENNIYEESNDECYFIDKIHSGENYQKVMAIQRKKEIEFTLKYDLSKLLIKLNMSYKEYISFIFSGVSEKDARKICKLKNDLLFEIAKINFRIIDGE